MKSPIVEVDGYNTIDKECARQLTVNGTYLPNVERVIFNLKTDEKVGGKDGKKSETKKLDVPILTTTVFWADGTTTIVKNSKHDPVGVEEKVLPDGSKVLVADACSKERAIVYATTKRTCGYPDASGKIVDTGMGRIITKIIDSGYDQNFENAKAEVLRNAKKAAYKASKNQPPKPKSKRYTYADCIQLAGPILEAIAKNPAVCEKLAAMIDAATAEQRA